MPNGEPYVCLNALPQPCHSNLIQAPSIAHFAFQKPSSILTAFVSLLDFHFCCLYSLVLCILWPKCPILLAVETILPVACIISNSTATSMMFFLPVSDRNFLALMLWAFYVFFVASFPPNRALIASNID
ncbi:hypothetical protein Tco_0449238 [Tanacetum coccineum]